MMVALDMIYNPRMQIDLEFWLLVILGIGAICLTGILLSVISGKRGRRTRNLMFWAKKNSNMCNYYDNNMDGVLSYIFLLKVERGKRGIWRFLMAQILSK